MPCCVAYRCSNRTDRKVEGLSFHRFPKDEELKLTWIKAVQRGDQWKPSMCSVLCSDHFEQDLFDRSSPFVRHLKKGAVPTKFHELPTDNKLKKSRKLRALQIVSEQPIGEKQPLGFEERTVEKCRQHTTMELLEITRHKLATTRQKLKNERKKNKRLREKVTSVLRMIKELDKKYVIHVSS